MDALEKRNPPGGAGFESADHGRGLHTHLTTMLPAPRDPQTIAGELYAAAERMADLAEILASGILDDRALSSADALLVGCGRLITELRQRQAVRT